MGLHSKKGLSLILYFLFFVIGAVIGVFFLLKATGLADINNYAHVFAALDIALIEEAFQAINGDATLYYSLNFPSKIVRIEENLVSVKDLQVNAIASQQKFSLRKDFKVQQGEMPMTGLKLYKQGEELRIVQEFKSKEDYANCLSVYKVKTFAQPCDRQVYLSYQALNNVQSHESEFKRTLYTLSKLWGCNKNIDLITSAVQVFFDEHDFKSEKLACLMYKHLKTVVGDDNVVLQPMVKTQTASKNPVVVLNIDQELLNTDLQGIVSSINDALNEYYS